MLSLLDELRGINSVVKEAQYSVSYHQKDAGSLMVAGLLSSFVVGCCI